VDHRLSARCASEIILAEFNFLPIDIKRQAPRLVQIEEEFRNRGRLYATESSESKRKLAKKGFFDMWSCCPQDPEEYLVGIDDLLLQ
jgi:hypothetical protein